MTAWIFGCLLQNFLQNFSIAVLHWLLILWQQIRTPACEFSMSSSWSLVGNSCTMSISRSTRMEQPLLPFATPSWQWTLSANISNLFCLLIHEVAVHSWHFDIIAPFIDVRTYLPSSSYFSHSNSQPSANKLLSYHIAELLISWTHEKNQKDSLHCYLSPPFILRHSTIYRYTVVRMRTRDAGGHHMISQMCISSTLIAWYILKWHCEINM